MTLYQAMEEVARQAIKIRSNFFDNTKKLEDCIPQVLLVRGDYLKEEITPRFVFEEDLDVRHRHN